MAERDAPQPGPSGSAPTGAESTEVEAAMQRALALAEQAAREGEVPVGAVVLFEGRIVGEGYNRREQAHDPLGHAEIYALGAAAQQLQRWRLSGCTLVVTLEPCAMCAGAVVNARIDRLVFGARDTRYGAVGSVLDIVRHPQLNHRAQVEEGLLAQASAELLRGFFAARRRRP